MMTYDGRAFWDFLYGLAPHWLKSANQLTAKLGEIFSSSFSHSDEGIKLEGFVIKSMIFLRW